MEKSGLTYLARLAACVSAWSVSSCGSTSPDGASPADAGAGDAPAGCELAANTTASGTTTPSGCGLLVRDTSACAAARTGQGLSGFWLKFSCRVTLTVSGDRVEARADGQPDYASNYFDASHKCHEAYSGAIQNPNRIAAKSYVVQFPRAPNTTAEPMRGAVVGLALNGVPVFGNFAAPGDDIFLEARTFDRCGAHPQMTGMYHYHSEPYSISYDDSRFIGVMRDGYPIYGRRDSDGTYPSLDTYGGHTGATEDSPATPVYHYHVNEQTSTSAGTAGEKQWFLTRGSWRGAAGPCTGCN